MVDRGRSIGLLMLTTDAIVRLRQFVQFQRILDIGDPEWPWTT